MRMWLLSQRRQLQQFLQPDAPSDQWPLFDIAHTSIPYMHDLKSCHALVTKPVSGKVNKLSRLADDGSPAKQRVISVNKTVPFSALCIFHIGRQERS
nr:hypothetical protein [Pseudomonas wenzhouensis]